MRVETEDANVEARAGVLRFYLGLIAQDVTDVLAQKALDALSHLLGTIDVALIKPPLPVGTRLERGDRLVDAIVPRNVGNQIADPRKRLERLHEYRFLAIQLLKA